MFDPDDKKIHDSYISVNDLHNAILTRQSRNRQVIERTRLSGLQRKGLLWDKLDTRFFFGNTSEILAGVAVINGEITEQIYNIEVNQKVMWSLLEMIKGLGPSDMVTLSILQMSTINETFFLYTDFL